MIICAANALLKAIVRLLVIEWVMVFFSWREYSEMPDRVRRVAIGFPPGGDFPLWSVL